jgi:hypothetical protein
VRISRFSFIRAAGELDVTSEIKNRSKERTNGNKAEFKRSEFVNYDLTQDDKARLKEWFGSKSFDPWNLIDKLIEAGYTLSIKPDSYHNCYAAYIQPVSADNPNAGYIISGRSGSATLAVFGALFRHLVLWEGDWPIDTVRRGGLDDE